MSEQNYEEGLLATLDTDNHEEVLSALLRASLVIELESSDEPPTEESVNRWARRLEPACKSMDRGMSIRTVTQNLAGAVDLLSDTGKELMRFLRFVDRLEQLIREQKRRS
jgi:hypothetical protein